MASFAKDFLTEEIKRRNPETDCAVFLTAFGKHPAWKDHVEAIGRNTPALIMAEQRLYEGVRRNIDLGAWKKLPAEEALPGFGHIFLWWRSGQFLMGRMWASSDHADPVRTEYPLIVCLHSLGVPLAWALRNLLPRLEEVPKFCQLQTAGEIDATARQARNSEAYRDELRLQVQSGFDHLQKELQVLAAGGPPAGTDPSLILEERQQFLDSTELGPDHEGLLRILHQVQNRFSAYSGRTRLTKVDGASLGPAQIRVPVAAPSAAEGMLRWIEFFRLVLAPETPILCTAPLGGGWIDVTVGEPTYNELFCLRASLKAVPVSSSIPFALDDALREEGSQILRSFLTNKSSEQTPKADLKGAATAFFRRIAPKSKRWMIIAGVFAALLVGIFAWPKRSPSQHPSQDAASSTPGQKTEAAPVVQRPRSEIEPGQALTLAKAAEQVNDFTNALAWYQRARERNPNDASVAEKIKELVPKAAEQVRLAEMQSKQEQQAVEEFAKAVTAAQAAERGGDFTNALVFYQRARERNTNDVSAAEKIKDLAPKAAEQVRLAEVQRKQEQQAVEEFVKALAAAQAAERGGSLTSALVSYQQAQKWNTNDASVAAKIQELAPKALEQMRLAEERRKQQIASAAREKQFNETLGAAQKAEQAKDLRGAISRYEEALRLKPGEPECVHRIQLLRQTVAEADALNAALAAARQAEQAKDSVAALEAYQKVLKLGPGNVEAIEAVARIQKAAAGVGPPPVTAVAPSPGSNAVPVSAPVPTSRTTNPALKTMENALSTERLAKELEQLDAELEVLLVRFGVVSSKDPRIHTAKAREEKKLGFLRSADKEYYRRRVEQLESNYKKGGWLNENDRAKFLNELKDFIEWR